jgi:sugar/nucleoside kinase (ribokinase family)
MNVVVVVGDVMNDVVVRALGRVQEGSDTDSEIRRCPGGSGANQAAWLASSGVPVRFYGRVGAHDAEAHAASLRGYGVDARLATDHEVPTGDIVVLVSGDGERSMFTDRGANARLSRGDLPADLDGVAHLHVSGYSLFEEGCREPVSALIADAVRRSLPVSCDPSSVSYLRRMGIGEFFSLTRGVGTIFPNSAEARLLAGARWSTTDDEAALALTDHYPVVVVKLGHGGAVLAARGARPLRSEAPEASVVDTTGAGDAFCAGYLAAVWRGRSPEDAVRAGLEVSAEAIGRMGGRPAPCVARAPRGRG